jgi:hypothetical protein
MSTLGKITHPLMDDYPVLRGVFVGGCIERGVGSRFRRKAHAHNHHGDRYFGWVCVLSAKRLFTASGGPSQLMLHEVAHLLVPDQGHTDRWRAQARAIGYRVQPHERKRTRTAAATR